MFHECETPAGRVDALPAQVKVVFRGFCAYSCIRDGKKQFLASAMSNLREVAERAGVSLATASRVASGGARVRTETRERVELAMRDLLYVPPSRAVSPSGAIGVLVPEFGNPIFPALTQAMEACASEAGFATIICNTAGFVRRELDYVHMLLERSVDGMIFICAELNDVRGEHAHYAQLVERGAHLVFVNGDAATLDVTSVGVDERAAGRFATEHLLELGHRRVGFVAGTSWTSPTREKLLGRQDALRAAGLDPDGLVAHAEYTVEGGREALRELLADPAGPPTGVTCSNDLMAIGAIREAGSHGLRVPGDLSVVGFDGTEIAAWLDPALTTIAMPLEEIAAAAVNALLAPGANGGAARARSLFRPRLVPGRTTAPPSRA
jgi:DNA-binding LacI/PurR family transcriptional regulator